jgi:hypothetical protein
MDSDDEFLDDGLDFDAIPAGTLLQLEQSAWQATQAAPEYDERSQSTSIQANRNQLNHDPRYSAPQRRESGFYGDVEVIDLDADILDNDEPLEDVVNSNPPVAQNVLHGRASSQRQYTPVQTQHVQPVQDNHDREIGARIEEVRRPS